MNHIDYDAVTGCWNTGLSKDTAGYGLIRDENKQLQKTHRVSYRLFKGEIPEGILVCHHCDNRACINPDHLFLGSTQDNMDDMVEKKRSNWKASITKEEMQAMRASGMTYQAIADQAGVKYYAVYAACNPEFNREANRRQRAKCQQNNQPLRS